MGSFLLEYQKNSRTLDHSTMDFYARSRNGKNNLQELCAGVF